MRGIARGATGIEDLETALRLVSGRPFDQLRPKGWSSLIDGDRVDHHMVCAVGDVTTHYLHAGDLDAPKQAASVGIQADPDSETARMDLAAIVIHEGHSCSAREIIAEVLADDPDLDATERIIEIFTRNHWLETGYVQVYPHAVGNPGINRTDHFIDSNQRYIAEACAAYYVWRGSLLVGGGLHLSGGEPLTAMGCSGDTEPTHNRDTENITSKEPQCLCPIGWESGGVLAALNSAQTCRRWGASVCPIRLASTWVSSTADADYRTVQG